MSLPLLNGAVSLRAECVAELLYAFYWLGKEAPLCYSNSVRVGRASSATWGAVLSLLWCKCATDLY